VQDPVLLHLDPSSYSQDSNAEADHFSYRFSIYRGGAFHRFETVADGPSDADSFHHHDADDESKAHVEHKLPLRLLAVDENYIVDDVLGVTLGNPDIEHITVARSTGMRVDNMLNRSSHASRASLSSKVSLAGSAVNLKNKGQQADGKKKVNFAPSAVPHRPTPTIATGAQPVNLSSTDGLVVASVFLPVHLHRSDNGEWTAHWDYEALLSMETHMRVTRVGTVKWRGWHGNYGRDGSPMTGVPVEERVKVEACLLPFNCVPVWIDTRLFGEMYNGFCKGVLWSVFHNVTSVYSAVPQGGLAKPPEGPPAPEEKFELDKEDYNAANLSEVSNQLFELMQDDIATGPIHGDGGKEASLWAAYTAVNRLFADAIIQCFNQGDMVWIHGFHLLILPSYLIRRIPMAKIGLFLHTPFPSSEIFRTLWCREDLLRGMLNADQVGFHLFEYARHFLTCCRRLLGLTYGMNPDTHGGYNLTVETGGRNVMVTSIHAGVEPPIINQLLYHSVTVEKVRWPTAGIPRMAQAFHLHFVFSPFAVTCHPTSVQRENGIRRI
jgi:trehalose-6-phosphate synthase